LFKRYEALAEAMPNVTFVGRLATYRYYNMDQVVGQALATFRRIGERIRTPFLVGGALAHADERPHVGAIVGAVKSPISTPPLAVLPARRPQAKSPAGPRANGAAPTQG